MVRRNTRSAPLAMLIPSVLVSSATGILGALTYIHNKPHFHTGGIIALLVGEFLGVVALPFLLIRTDLSLTMSTAITGASALLSLGAGLQMVDTSILLDTATITRPVVFKAFVSLFVASLLFGGVALGSQIQLLVTEWEYEEEYEDDIETEKIPDGRYRSNSGTGTLKEKMVSLKASAATLVDTAGRHDDNLTISHSNKSRGSPKEALTMFKRGNNTNTNETIPNYSIKKLSVINQSTSTVNMSDYNCNLPPSRSGNTLKSGLFTPTLSRFKDVESSSKTMMLERDALKRIPSVLLPPHLKPHNNNGLGQERRGSEPFMNSSHTVNDISSQYFEGDVIQQIPRAHTVNNMMPFFKDTPSGSGMRTISLDDYEKNYDQIQQMQLMGSHSQIFQRPPLQTPAFFTPPSEEMEDIALESEECPESIVDSAPEADDSTDEALKYLANAGASHDNEILMTAMDQTASNINLQTLETFEASGLSKIKSHSPHKSIFGHSRKGSQFSLRANSASLPGSPVRGSRSKRSPRKLGIKNLSLSSIVYKDEKNADVPNFSYVHELQSSPTKKKTHPQTPLVKSKTFDVLMDKTNTTPDSNWSENSNHSVFPSEVIGEYDKEKWKTMMRLQMVGQENSE